MDTEKEIRNTARVWSQGQLSSRATTSLAQLQLFCPQRMVKVPGKPPTSQTSASVVPKSAKGMWCLQFLSERNGPRKSLLPVKNTTMRKKQTHTQRWCSKGNDCYIRKGGEVFAIWEATIIHAITILHLPPFTTITPFCQCVLIFPCRFSSGNISSRNSPSSNHYGRGPIFYHVSHHTKLKLFILFHNYTLIPYRVTKIIIIWKLWSRFWGGLLDK